MFFLLDCPNCRTLLQLPPRAQSVRCTICHAIIRISDSQSALPPRSAHFVNKTNCNCYPPPSPYNHAPSGQLPHAQGRKRALIVGVSYKNTSNELKGCINDAVRMKNLLINRFKFPESSILMLTEEERDPSRLPTKYNMRMALYWLVQGCQPGDSLVFHFSGHGSQQRNYEGDEVDGKDETLCPMDFQTHGMIVDDEINATIVKPLPRGAKLHAIIDACHSGTVLDLPFLCRMNRYGEYEWEDHRPRSGMWKGTSGGEAFCFSGCDDYQKSADSPGPSEFTFTGAMTSSFIQAIERGQATTYGNLLNVIRSSILNADNELDRGLVTSLITKLLTRMTLAGRLRQEPQLTATEPFEVYLRSFSL